MKLDFIEKAVESGMILHTWDDNQSSGIWLLLADSNEDAKAIQALSEKGSKENEWLKDFAHGKGDEITLVLSDSLDLGLQTMEVRLSEMSEDIFHKDSLARKELNQIYHAIKINA